MADVPVTIFRGRKTRAGTSPSIPSGVEGEPLPPINPPGSNPGGGSKIHNDLEEIQGGIEGERYHLTLAEKDLIGAGGNDPNAVHYNANDLKSVSEKQRAKENVGSSLGIATELASYTFMANLPRTTNFYIINGTGNANLTGFVAGVDGERVYVMNQKTAGILVATPEFNSSLNNRLGIGKNYTITAGETVCFVYTTLLNRWVFDDFYKNYGLIGLAGQQINMGSTPQQGIYMLNLEADAGGAELLRLRNYRTVSNQVFIRGYNSAGTQVFRIDEMGFINPDGSIGVTQFQHRIYQTATNTTVGVLNDMGNANGNWGTRILIATGLTGIANGRNWKRHTIYNLSGGTLTVSHQSVLSIAANRFNLIGGVDLIIPALGIADFYYEQTDRWLLASKNF